MPRRRSDLTRAQVVAIAIIATLATVLLPLAAFAATRYQCIQCGYVTPPLSSPPSACPGCGAVGTLYPIDPDVIAPRQ